jgi:hypothetical protein
MQLPSEQQVKAYGSRYAIRDSGERMHKESTTG